MFIMVRDSRKATEKFDEAKVWLKQKDIETAYLLKYALDTCAFGTEVSS